jgi:hypothetical protein
MAQNKMWILVYSDKLDSLKLYERDKVMSNFNRGNRGSKVKILNLLNPIESGDAYVLDSSNTIGTLIKTETDKGVELLAIGRSLKFWGKSEAPDSILNELSTVLGGPEVLPDALPPMVGSQRPAEATTKTRGKRRGPTAQGVGGKKGRASED